MKELEFSGVLLLDKPAGITSHDAVNRVRRLFQTKQVGHTGTLDPMATGLLPILIGRAVKASEYLLSSEKRYEALLKLGLETDTEDLTGKVLSQSGDLPKKDDVFSSCAQFKGKQKQVPPMYSALKKNGQKLVDLARKGIEFEREARDIEIFELECAAVSEEEGLYRLLVHCSKGTYIRSLCRDIGKSLGCGGCMASLRRISSGSFNVGRAVTLEELEKMTADERVNLLLPLDSLFEELPRLNLPPFYRRLASSGCPVYLSKIKTDIQIGKRVRLYDGDRLFALGEVGIYPEGVAVKAIKQFILYEKEISVC